MELAIWATLEHDLSNKGMIMIENIENTIEDLPKELKEKLEKFAKQRANEVEDVSIDEFIQCVLDGALWMCSNAT